MFKFENMSFALEGTTTIPDAERDQQVTRNIQDLNASDCKRVISIFKTAELEGKWKSDPANAEPPAGKIEEHVLFWPSAPIYALGWPRIHSIPEEHRNPWHTMRLLKRPGQETIQRVYLFFNGLNEVRTFQTYYRLADLLFRNEERRRKQTDPEFKLATSACIIRPFPGHLTRHPYSASFFKLPMAHYLEDAAELYRQFLRYMVETQWLLSALVPFEDIPLKTGLDLLAKGERKEDAAVANAILEAWRALEKADMDARKATNTNTTGVPAPYPQLELGLLTKQITRLRDVTSWRLAPHDWNSMEGEDLFRPLSIHGIGYSMGGFIAQATMFTWPQIVATCTMLASGGTLADVHVSFVHEDEWLYVLDRLLPDLENLAIAQQIPVFRVDNTQTPLQIYGLPRGYYSAFRRAFDQILGLRGIEWVNSYFFKHTGQDFEPKVFFIP